MKKVSIVFLVLLVVVGSAFARGTKAARHGTQVAGEIMSVNQTAKSLVISQAGKDMTIYWTAATKVTGGSLAAGERATIRSMQKDGKWIATSVKVTGAASTKPAPAKKPA